MHPPALTADTWFKRAVTPTLNFNTCTEETNIVRVTVINFAPGSIGSDQTICEGTAPAAFTSVAASGDGVKTYQWQNSTDNITFDRYSQVQHQCNLYITGTYTGYMVQKRW